ncbi:MAG: hypothetical protein K0R71_10 [Bacillales bacterium]|jgi:hypothetical protein|nr:hypothetical protein [Bacillales bacterium]
MRIKEGFLLKEIAGSYLVVPSGADDVGFTKMITTNETGAYLWNLIQEDQTVTSLIEKLCDSYNVSQNEAFAEVLDFIKVLSVEQLLVHE